VTTILPEGESLRKAVRWISEQLEEKPNASKQKLISEAAFRFDLTPNEVEFLVRFYKEQEGDI